MSDWEHLGAGFTKKQWQVVKNLLTKERQKIAKAIKKEVVAVQGLKMTKENGLISIHQAIDSYLKKQEGG